MESFHRVSLQWIPEDDLLLRNAVEAGASLEALAKGAVEFSRRYTVQELKERWHSLLYDDDISSQASYHMFELEISGASSTSKYRQESSTARNKDAKKRKPESIRKKYYAIRKRLRTEFSSDIDMGFLEPKNYVVNEHAADFQEHVIPGGNSVDQIDFSEEEMLDILRRALPSPGNAEGAPVEYGIGNVAEHVNPDFFEEDHQNRIMGIAGFNEDLATSSGEGRSDNPTASLEVLLSARNDLVDDDLRNNLDGFDARQKFHSPSYDCVDAVFACEEAQLQTWAEIQDDKSHVPPASMGLPRSPNADDSVVDAYLEKETKKVVSTGEIADADSLFNLPNEVEYLLMDFSEKSVAVDRCCTLDIDRVRRDSVNGSLEVTADVCQVDTFPDSSLEVTNSTDILTQECSGSVIYGDVVNSQSILDLPTDFTVISDGKVICVLNREDPEIPCNDDVFHHTGSPFHSETQPGAAILPFTTACSLVNREHEPSFNSMSKETIRSSDFLRMNPRVAENCVKREALGIKFHWRWSSLSDQCEEAVNNLPGASEAVQSRTDAFKHPEFADEYAVSDDSQMESDVPYFSDVEAMILEMELDPYDEDLHINRKDPSYQYDETKRTIIRLEQGARSCLQRAMTSQGAFAILYGRYSKHYIRKTEVLVGRSTEDIAVDIDLAIEGRANKVSRRQAIIKMEANGSFFMKNLGRSSILLNRTTVLCGQVVNLSSGCLIEIKGMSFLFEINQGMRRKEEPC